MKFLEDYLKEKCLSCKVCCRFPEKYSPFVPFFLDKEIKDLKYFHCLSNSYGCRTTTLKYGNMYVCPYFNIGKNNCNIYSRRPLDCRLYPFMITYDSDYKKVILVLDNNCPYTQNIAKLKDKAIDFINSNKIDPQNFGLLNDYQPNTTFISELPHLTKFIIGEGGELKKLSLKDITESTSFIPLCLWKDIMNLVWKKEGNNIQIFYGFNSNYTKIRSDLPPHQLQCNWCGGVHEYIYLKKDLIELKGDKYKDKRNLCNYFQKNYSYKIEKLFPNEDNIDGFLNLYKKWSDDKIKNGINPYHRQLIEDSFFFHKRAFLDYCALGLKGIILKTDNNLAGYTFGFESGNETFYILAEIADRRFRGINQFIFREFCCIIPEKFVYINTMDDSGIEALRKNKMSYHPIQ